jgi:uncharacterized damage-inducible protein DinB
MKFTVLLCGAAVCAGMAVAADQTAAPNVSKIFDSQLSSVEREVVSLAEAMPADKYEFAPTQGEFKGVRTFALQVRHIATVNLEIATGILGEKMPVDAGPAENGPDSIKSKDDLVKYLKDSFAKCHKAAGTLTNANFTELLTDPFGGSRKVARGYVVNIPIWHSFDHYGQMVVYARMNGIVPPASRQQ